MTQRQYPRAPITEAVIGWDFVDSIDDASVDKLRSRLKAEYPFEQELRQRAIALSPDGSTNVSDSRMGWRLATADQLEIVIVGNRRLSVSRLAPYTGWNAFRAVAERHWHAWRGIAGYRKIGRIGVRYINRIDIPLAAPPPIDLGTYLTLKLDVPQPPFPPVGHATTQATFEFPECTVVVNMGVVPPALVNHLSYALDFDFGRDRDVPQSDDALWSYIDGIRSRKNMLFEASITDRTRALFEA